MPSIEIKHWLNADVPPDLLALVPVWRGLCFPGPQSAVVWAATDWHQWVFAAEEPVSTLRLLTRTVTFGGQPVTVGGIAGVMTPPAHQGRGYASASLRAATDFVRDRLGLPFAMLGCYPHMAPFYVRLGWTPLPGDAVFEHPGGLTGQRFSWHDVILIMPLADQPWPQGDLLDFNGLPW
jgi:GNAT superfamily N-acetyltransferase